MRHNKLVLDSKKLDKVFAYIKTSEVYTLKNLLHELKLDENMQLQGNNYLISCPFHSDSSPSFSINFEQDVYKCFGCPTGGGYLNLYRDYYSHFHSPITMAEAANKLLQKDSVMRNSLGFNSVFKTETTKKVDINKIEFRKRKPVERFKYTTYQSVANKMLKDKKSTSDKLYMIALMQGGMNPNEIYKTIYEDLVTKDENISDKENKNTIDYSNIDIGKLMGGGK